MDTPPKPAQAFATVYLELELGASLVMTSIIGAAAATITRRQIASLIVDG
jgi:hypothetical protein